MIRRELHSLIAMCDAIIANRFIYPHVRERAHVLRLFLLTRVLIMP